MTRRSLIDDDFDDKLAALPLPLPSYQSPRPTPSPASSSHNTFTSSLTYITRRGHSTQQHPPPHPNGAPPASVCHTTPACGSTFHRPVYTANASHFTPASPPAAVPSSVNSTAPLAYVSSVDNSRFSTEHLEARAKSARTVLNACETLHIVIKREHEEQHTAMMAKDFSRAFSAIDRVAGHLVQLITRLKLPTRPIDVEPQRPAPLPPSVIADDLLEWFIAVSHNLAQTCVDHRKLELAADLSFCCLQLIVRRTAVNLAQVKMEASMSAVALYELAGRTEDTLRDTHARGIRAISNSVLSLLAHSDPSRTIFEMLALQGHMMQVRAAREILKHTRHQRAVTKADLQVVDDAKLDLTAHIDVFYSTRRVPDQYHKLIALAMWLKLNEAAVLMLEKFFAAYSGTKYESRLYITLVDDTLAYQHALKLLESNGALLCALHDDASRERTWIAQDVWNRGARMWREGRLEQAVRMIDVATLMVQKIVEINEADEQQRGDSGDERPALDRDKLRTLQAQLPIANRMIHDAKDLKKQINNAKRIRVEEEGDNDEDGDADDNGSSEGDDTDAADEHDEDENDNNDDDE